jgi:hypothetical protein
MRAPVPLPRLQLFELEDLGWFPPTIRDLATDYLHFMETRFALHKPVVPLLRDLLLRSNTTSIVDLCSGGGGPVLAIWEEFLAEGSTLHITLTDKFPNVHAFARLAALHPGGIFFRVDAIDAANVPSELVGVRTFFNAFHHFGPNEARAALESAVKARQPVGIFEIPERSLAMMLPFLFSPLFVALATPFIRPFGWKRLLWTYIVPLIPLTCWWDGLISQWRAYTVAELLALTNGLDGYAWKAGRVRISGKFGHVTFLTGIPITEGPPGGAR